MSVIEKTYFCPLGRQSFDVCILDSEGKKVPDIDANGVQRYFDGKKQWLQRLVAFDTIQGKRTSKADPLCCYTVKSSEEGKFEGEDLEIFNTLERLADDSGSKVMRDADYRKKKNPQAYNAEVNLEKANNKVAELQAQLAAALESGQNKKPKTGKNK